MNENIVGRVSRLISGGFNALIDAAEGMSPVLVMKENVREVNSAIADIRKELGLSIVRKENINASIKNDKLKHEELKEQIAIAIEGDREDLAASGVGKQIDIEAQLNVLEEALSEEGKNINKFEGYITALQGKAREMEEAIEDFCKATEEVETAENTSNTVAKAEAAFARVSGHVGKPSSPSDKNKEVQKLKELSEMQRDTKIKTRMAGLKRIGN